MARAVFWVVIGLLLYTHAGYPALLWLLVRRRRRPNHRRGALASEPFGCEAPIPRVSLIVAAHNEDNVIEARVTNVRSLDYPNDRLEMIVASDGSTDRTVELAREAGADRVLDLPRVGKVRAQDAAVEAASGELLAFSDANSAWALDALHHLVAPFAAPDVGYVCGQVTFRHAGGSNQEGLYWRYENGVRSLESRLAGITGGNGAIYAVRRSAYMRLDARTSHDLSFPFNMVRGGWRAIYEPQARADEGMAPSLEGEFRRKRRMMRRAWPTVLHGGLLSPRGYPPLYALEVASHRGLRYASPALHVIAVVANAILAVRGVRSVRLYRSALVLQAGIVAAAAAVPALPAAASGSLVRPARLARYYVLVTAAIAAGLWDHLREGTPDTWEREAETR